MYVHHKYTPCSWGTEEGVGSYGMGTVDNPPVAMWVWELYPGPFEEHGALNHRAIPSLHTDFLSLG